MMKAFSLFFLLLALAITTSFAQGTGVLEAAGQSNKEAKAEPQKLEASISPAEQAQRDLLVPRKYQEQLAIEAAKPIKYGPSTSGRKSYYRKSPSKRKYYGKRRRSSRRR